MSKRSIGHGAMGGICEEGGETKGGEREKEGEGRMRHQNLGDTTKLKMTGKINPEETSSHLDGHRYKLESHSVASRCTP
ncbi:hypothetical protein Dda_3804 [Drechslerella dactyloides]|uniref:Uncharacterized protein n=1 Tax=Drechslerella dactyloides TaxID=74499 RepID=A0AAD6IYL8_DREDA|nr:hypothetical protein Dda_3804 [Drechslerella dactyloides]